MTPTLYLITAAVAVVVLYFVAAPILRFYRRFRGTRVVTCPENQEHAAVEVDTSAAIQSAFGTPKLSLENCSRWPEKAGCGQQCLSQIEAAPDDCLVRNILTRWYEGKTCVVCGKPLGPADWYEHKPALMSPQQKTVEWGQIAPERVLEVLENHRPVCWDCHIASTFRSEHSDLVLDRPWHKEGYK